MPTANEKDHMEHTDDVVALREKIRHAARSTDGPSTSFDLSRSIEYSSSSPCGRVTVFMSGTGQMKDVLIDDDALERLNREQLEPLILGTIQRAEQMLRDALSSIRKESP